MFQASTCRLVPLARRAEVEAAQQFAHEQNVGAIHDLRTQRAVHRQFPERKRGAQIGEPAQLGPNLQQSGFRPLVRGKGIELVAAHRAQQNSIARQCFTQRVGRQRSSVLHDGHAADAAFRKREFVSAQFGHFAQNLRPLHW